MPLLRAVVTSQFDDGPIDRQPLPSELLAQQMLRHAMGHIWPGYYQVTELKILSDAPAVTKSLSEMTESERSGALYHRRTRTVVLSGRIVITQEDHQLRCDCVMHDQRMVWEPASLTVSIGPQTFNFTFRPEAMHGGIHYVIDRPAGDEGPQPAEI